MASNAMEQVKGAPLPAPLAGFTQLPMVRQIGLLVGLAAVVALGVVVFLWSQTPSYRLLYSNLADRDAAQVIEALQAANVPYKVDAHTGAITVPASQVHETRLRLAGQGLPSGGGVGFEMLQKDQGFGTSQFMETARFQRALEAELARSIMTLTSVEGARVHLATPKQSVFLRDRQKPSASVLVNLYRGRTLDDGQVSAIVHMVASSIPELEPEQVTVVDQNGNLFTSHREQDGIERNGRQLDYVRRLEETYIARVLDLLTPIVGADGVRAQVVADVDFTVTEQTQETFNPDLPAVRSEQRVEEQSTGITDGGVPGALTNQPPGAGAAPEVVAQGEGVERGVPSRSSRRATVNYELDRTLSHTRREGGALRRVTVAVVLDDRRVANEEGELVRAPWPDEELERLTGLVREAVGFSMQRGDSVSVMNVPFAEQSEGDAFVGPDMPFWKEPWFWDTGKQLLGLLVILFLILGVLRPVLRNLATKPEPPPPVIEDQRPDRVTLSGDGTPQLPGHDEYQANLQIAQQMVEQDSKRVAQVVKTWLALDGAKN